MEAAYYQKTKLFPIMHGIGIRRSIVEKYPWVAVNVFKAFIKAKGRSGQADRLFAGKEGGESLVRLADREGRPRLVLKVDAAGEPSIELLDGAGKVSRRITGS